MGEKKKTGDEKQLAINQDEWMNHDRKKKNKERSNNPKLITEK
jgi:hypothetical protein